MSGRWILLASLLFLPSGARGEDRILDWVKVTDRAGWPPRDSSGEVWSLEVPRDSFEAKPAEKMSLLSAVEGEAARRLERCPVGATCRLGTASTLSRE